MSKYRCGIAFAEACNREKDEIRHALRGEVISGEDENGFVYRSGSKQECESVIMGAYDGVVYNAISSQACTRALEEFIKIMLGETINLELFSQLLEKERAKDTVYKYEPDLEAAQ